MALFIGAIGLIRSTLTSNPHMTTQKKDSDSGNHPTHHEKKTSSAQPVTALAGNQGDIAVNNFIRFYDARATFFSEAFIKKLKDGNRKALSELQRHSVQPTHMDLRQELAKCVKANISDAHPFQMNDGKRYTMQELKQLVPEWTLIAEKALMESDPALADKLMSPVQWTAKVAFEVTFVSAMNELRDIKKARQADGSYDHYMKWIINPLQKAIEQVKAVDPPGNSLIGYGDRIPLSEAMAIAENLPDEFRKVLAGKR
jgi:hypothetical protein